MASSFAIILLCSFLTQSTSEMAFSYVVNCFSYSETKNAEYLTENGFNVEGSNDEYITFSRGSRESSIDIEFWRNPPGNLGYEWVVITLNGNKESEYHNLTTKLKASGTKVDFFLGKGVNQYVSQYSLNGLNFYFYSMANGEFPYRRIIVAKKPLGHNFF